MRQLIGELMVARAAMDGNYNKLLGNLRKARPLIVDDLLLHDITAPDMGELLELVDARLLTRSTVFCSQHRHDGRIKIMGRTPISETFVSRVKASPHAISVESADDLRLSNVSL